MAAAYSFLVLVLLVVAASAFSPVRSSTAIAGAARAAALSPLRAKTEEQTIKDLNLEQMFDTFEAADKAVKTSDLPKGVVSQYDEKRSVVQDGSSGVPPAAIILGALLGVGVVAFTQLNH